MRHPKIYIDTTEAKGRGVFTGKSLKAGLMIERAPVIIMSHEDRLLLDQTLLHNYIFEWQPDGANMVCVALGYISMYNHSYEANCEYFMDYENDTMFVQTVRAIDAGEELTINYNGTWNNKDKVWFDTTE